jgi:hypothetical protein
VTPELPDRSALPRKQVGAARGIWAVHCVLVVGAARPSSDGLVVPEPWMRLQMVPNAVPGSRFDED